jgi:hypothetical protein
MIKIKSVNKKCRIQNRKKDKEGKRDYMNSIYPFFDYLAYSVRFFIE